MVSSVDDTTISSQITTSTHADVLLSENSDDQSSLTSVPSDIGSTPEGFNNKTLHQTVTSGSPGPICRRSKRQRKLSTRATQSENSSPESTQRNVKRRKTSASAAPLTDTSTQLSSSRLPSVRQRLSKASNAKSKGPTKIVLKCPQQPSFNNAHEKYQQWPVSDVRNEPPPPSGSKIPLSNLSQQETRASIKNDIEISFLAKIKNQRYELVNSAVVISDYVGQSSSDKSVLKVGKANKKRHARATQSTAASGAGRGSNTGSGAPSPSEKAGKPTGVAKNAKGQGKFGKGKSRNGGNGGKDRDSPEPHEKLPRTHHDQVFLKSLRQRQSELKKWFAMIGAQQTEALEIISSRDLSKLHKKSSAHTKVPEYDELLQSLQAKRDNVKYLADTEYKMRQELAIQTFQAQKAIIENSFLNRARGAKAEHLKGAEGDLMILQNAHKSQIDETRTDNGSEGATNLPLYHEIPEANARIRGYSSMRVDDEKPFKEHLPSYDEQAQREVIDDDIVAPVMLSVAQENAERSAEEERKARQKLNELASISVSELERINSQHIPKSPGPETNPQFALSRLADCADLVSRRKSYSSAPETPRNPRTLPELPRETPTNPRTLPEIPREPLPNLRPTQIPSLLHNSPPTQPTLLSPAPSRPKSPPARKKKSISAPPKRVIKEEEPQSQSSSNTSTPLPNIAPAPSKMPPPPVFNQHHHHHLPQPTMPPPPSSMTALPTFPRHSNLAPLIIPKTRSTPPGTPIHNQGHPLSAHIPPPPSPFQPRPSPAIGTYQHQQPTPRPMPPYSPLSHPPPLSPFLIQSPQLPNFERTRRLSIEQQQQQQQRRRQQQQQPPRQQQQSNPQQPLQQPPRPPPPPSTQPQPQAPRFALTNTVSQHVTRPLGQRRGSGQITFTPTQTPSSERFTRPPGPAPQLPGRSVIRPNQLANGTGTAPHRLGSMVVSNAAESRAQSAADIARQNALKNQVQGAGPKGGKRVLLPKS